MKYFQLIIIVAMGILYGCHNPLQKTEGNVATFRFPVLIDTFGIDSFWYYAENRDAGHRGSRARYVFNFIGKIQDTIYPSPLIDFLQPKPTAGFRNVVFEYTQKYGKYYKKWTQGNHYRYYDSSEIEILVDTNTRLAGMLPVLLINKDKDTVVIGHESFISLIMEAKDSKGNWFPIQGKNYHCGNSGTVMLPPQECALTLAPVFRGSYKTQLRMTLGKNHSKPFAGSY